MHEVIIKQTAFDYDLPVHTVQKIAAQYPGAGFYEALEEELIIRREMNNRVKRPRQETPSVTIWSAITPKKPWVFKRIVCTGLGMEIEKREDGNNCYIGPIPTHIITRATDAQILLWAKLQGAIITYWGNDEC